LEKLSSKGEPQIDGAGILTTEMDKADQSNRTAIAFMRGQVDGQNKARFAESLAELKRRELQGADIKIADYIAQTYQEKMPCYAINHPTPHVLTQMYNQVAKLAGFVPAPSEMNAYDMGRATLPAGNGGLTPYCVEALDLAYPHESHWFSANNRITGEIARKWDRIHNLKAS
jgi:hypothetical protein